VKVLVVKMSSMGDIVHAQPLVADIRRNVPDAVVDWVCEASFQAIPALNPAVSQVIPLSWRRWRRHLGEPATREAMRAFRDRLRTTTYDWVIDCQGLIKSAVVARMARARRRAGLSWSSAREPLASLAYDVGAKVPWDRHVVARNRLVAAAALGYRVEGPPEFGLRVAPLAADWLRVGPDGGLGGEPGGRPGGGLLPAARGDYVVMIPGASRAQKLWPESHWIEIGHDLMTRGAGLVWLWGNPDELARVRRLAAACAPVHDAGPVHDAAPLDDAAPLHDAAPVHGLETPVRHGDAGPTTGARSLVPPFLGVADAARLLAGASGVVGLDTGLTHLGAALGRPTIGIFCDFDAVQCAVTGDAFCASFGGVGVVPPVSDIRAAIADGALAPQSNSQTGRR